MQTRHSPTPRCRTQLPATNPSRPPGGGYRRKKVLRMCLKNTCGVHIYSLIAAAGTPRSWYRQLPAWVHVGSFARGDLHPPAGLPSCRASHLLGYQIATVRPPPSRHSPAHQCPQCGCAPSDPASTTDADTATGQPRRGYPSPPGRPAPES